MAWGQFHLSITQHYFQDNGRAICGAYQAHDLGEIRTSHARRCASCTRIITQRVEVARRKLERAMIALDRVDGTPDVIRPCKHPNPSFDRSICACGAMHYYCTDCGEQIDPCDPEAA